MKHDELKQLERWRRGWSNPVTPVAVEPAPSLERRPKLQIGKITIVFPPGMDPVKLISLGGLIQKYDPDGVYVLTLKGERSLEHWLYPAYPINLGRPYPVASTLEQLEQEIVKYFEGKSKRVDETKIA